MDTERRGRGRPRDPLDVRVVESHTYVMKPQRYNVSALRADLYRVLDRALESGVAVEVERHGRVLRIVPDVPSAKLSRLVRRACLRGDPESIVHCDWSSEWKPAP